MKAKIYMRLGKDGNKVLADANTKQGVVNEKIPILVRPLRL